MSEVDTMSTLKVISSKDIPSWIGSSAEILGTKVKAGKGVRSAYMQSYTSCDGPVISSSEFVPRKMIEHLMKNKKNGALGVKFVPGRRDAITNMEGALHTFVNPLVVAWIHGDYVFRGGHTITPFPVQKGMQCARKVIMSAFIHPDFENSEVMVTLASLGQHEFIGVPLPTTFVVPTRDEKQDAGLRQAYDDTLRRHMVAHLVESRTLPSISQAAGGTMPLDQVCTFLESVISGKDPIPPLLTGKFAKLEWDDNVVSLELLWRSAYYQARNEFSALEHLCPQGYIYTFDPPSIFAQRIDASVLNRLYIAALAHLSRDLGCTFRRMLVFGFNDYADDGALDLLRTALKSQTHLRVVAKKDLFTGHSGTYAPLSGTEKAILVVHNNSDGFGQNIETEGENSSLDGAIGWNSSAAASLHRDHPGLLDHLV